MLSISEFSFHSVMSNKLTCDRWSSRITKCSRAWVPQSSVRTFTRFNYSKGVLIRWAQSLSLWRMTAHMASSHWENCAIDPTALSMRDGRVGCRSPMVPTRLALQTTTYYVNHLYAPIKMLWKVRTITDFIKP